MKKINIENEKSLFAYLRGCVITKISGLEINSNQILIYTTDPDGDTICLFMSNDNESDAIFLDDFEGNINDIVGNKVVDAYLSINEKEVDDDMERWNFYHISMSNGSSLYDSEAFHLEHEWLYDSEIYFKGEITAFDVYKNIGTGEFCMLYITHSDNFSHEKDVLINIIKSILRSWQEL